MKYLFCIMCLFIAHPYIYGQEFTSPRATALGAYTAVSNDAYGADWNLAATTFSEPNLEIAFSDSWEIEGFEDFRLLWRPWNRHVIAFRRTPSFRVDHFIFKLPLRFPPETPLDFLADLWYEEDRGVGYAIRFSPEAAVGFDLRRHIYSNIFSSSRFWSLNLSLHLQISQTVSFGLIYRNIYNYHYQKPNNRLAFYKGDSLHVIAMDFESFQWVYSEPAWRLDLGLAIRPWQRLLLAADFFTDGGYGTGFEWEAFRSIFLRMGVNHKSDRLFKPEKVFGLSWGLGVIYGNARFDLAYYFPYGSRGSRLERTSFGDFSITPIKSDMFMVSALFSID